MRHNTTGRTRCGAALALLLALTAIPARALEPKPLPAFELVDLDGRPVSGPRLAVPGPWLLLYVAPGPGASRALLGALRPAGDDGGAAGGVPADRVVVVVGGSPAEARLLR